MPDWTQSVAELVGWYVLAVLFIAAAIRLAGRYMERHPSQVERLAEDRLAHVKEYSRSRQDSTTAQLEELWRL